MQTGTNHLNQDALNAQSALHSAEFARQIYLRAQEMSPELQIEVFGLSQIKHHEQLDDPKTSQRIGEYQELHTEFGEGAAQGIDAYGWRDSGEKELPMFVTVRDPDSVITDAFSGALKTKSENIVINEDIDFDYAVWVADHELGHAEIHKRIFEKERSAKLEEPASINPDRRMLSLHEDKEYELYLHECTADLYAVMSAVHDGADPETTIDTICAYRSASLLNKSDIHHFSTPVLEASKDLIIKNEEKIRQFSREELVDKSIHMILGDMENLQDLTANARVSQELYQEFKEASGVTIEEKKGKDPVYHNSIRSKINTEHLLEEGDNAITLAESSNVLKDNPELEGTKLGHFIKRYIQPYEYIVHTRSDVEKGLIEPKQQIKTPETEQGYSSQQNIIRAEIAAREQNLETNPELNHLSINELIELQQTIQDDKETAQELEPEITRH